MTPDLEDEIESSNCELCVTRREARGPSLNRHPGQERTQVLGCPGRSTSQFVSYQHSFEINWHLMTPRKQAHTDLRRAFWYLESCRAIAQQRKSSM